MLATVELSNAADSHVLKISIQQSILSIITLLHRHLTVVHVQSTVYFEMPYLSKCYKYGLISQS